jgi:hypothetical protein
MPLHPEKDAPHRTMRNYMYIWHDPDRRLITASGIEFRDFASTLCSNAGVVLLRHESEAAVRDFHSGFDYVPYMYIAELIAEDTYSWGDFVWTDYEIQQPSTPDEFPALSPEEIAELLYFAHTARPLRQVAIPRLHNRFLLHGHDDGWLLRAYYSAWSDVADMLSSIIPKQLGEIDMSELLEGQCAYWLEGGATRKEMITNDIDSLLNARS